VNAPARFDPAGHDVTKAFTCADAPEGGAGKLVPTQEPADSQDRNSPSTIKPDNESVYESEGGLWRGCDNETTHPVSGVPSTTITIEISWPWGASGPATSCTVADPKAHTCAGNDDPVGSDGRWTRSRRRW
jgi:hypothetical protein